MDFRYYGPDEEMVGLLSPYVTERARVEYEKGVECALARVLARRGVCDAEDAEAIERAAAEVTAEEIATEEARIHHNIRAMVNCIRRRVPEKARPYVHLCATSFDIIDTAMAARFRDCARQAIVPTMLDLERTLIHIAEREKGRLQIGRTHGQHAVPITFGFAIAEYVSRLGNRILAIQSAAAGLRGKFSGAVGAYNASRLLFDDPEEFEREVLAELGLEPSLHSTQIVEPEPLTDFFHALVSCFSVLAALADDMRHLQRTEIGEVGEAFAADQVGSSTMPHKRNPWNFENVKSMYKAFLPRMISVYLDQLSEHQRDLTNSATNRFLPEIIVGLVSSARRMNRVMCRLVVDAERMQRNFDMSRGMITAEPLYILLAALGHPDAHEVVRRITVEAEKTHKPLIEVVKQSAELAPYLERMTTEQRALLDDPSRYVGIASEKTQVICDRMKSLLNLA